MNSWTLDRSWRRELGLVSTCALLLASGATVAGCSNDEGKPNSPASTGGSASSGGKKPVETTVTAGRSSAGAGGATGSGGTGPRSDAGEAGAGEMQPRGPVDPSCHLPDAAFCDAFAEASPGGRAGDLDDANWSLSRLGFGCAYAFAFPESPINLCGVWKTVHPGGADSQFCVNEDNEPRWSEGFDDNTDFNYLSARIRQPFDFEGRTGTVQWSADARTAGSHGWWTETWITNDAVPGPNLHDPDQLVTSKEAIGVTFDLNCGLPAQGLGTAGSGKVGVTRILVAHDYATKDVYDPFSPMNANSRCVTSEQGTLNTFQIRISTGRIEVWASNAGSDELTRIAEADLDLPFSRGFVHVSHVHYNAHKAEVTTFQSYQWARIAFDGPQLAVPRAYELPDPLTPVHTDCLDKDAFRIAYQVTDGATFDIGEGPSKPRALTFSDVDPTDGVAARLNFNTTYVAGGDVLKFRFNGKQWRDYTVPALNTNWARQGFSIPVPLEDLVAGDNSVEFGTNSNPGIGVPANSMDIANVDLEIEVP